MKSPVLPILYILLPWLLLVWIICKKAYCSRRNVVLWGVFGILFGPIAWIVIQCIGINRTAEMQTLPRLDHEDPYHELYTIRQMYAKGHISKEEYDHHAQKLLRKI